MAYENIKFKYPNLLVKDGYFYTFDSTMNALVQKVDDGVVAFTYPTSSVIGANVVSLEYAGGYFWTLQSSNVVKKWQIENYVCVLKSTLTLSPYVSEAFTLENYSTTLSSDLNPGENLLYLNDYTSAVVSGTSFMVNDLESFTATSVSGTAVVLSAPAENFFSAGEKVELHNDLWMFNVNSIGGLANEGSLLRIDSTTGTLKSYTNSNEYKSIKACTFYVNTSGAPISDACIVYVNSTSLKFLDITNLNNVDIMTMDNIRINGSTVITVYDISISNAIAYRLQLEGTYYGTNNSWTTYNYQASPVRKFLDSIAANAVSSIVNSDGVSLVEVNAVINDQYNTALASKPITFTDDNPTGYIVTSPVNTKSNGVATTYYRAGTSPAHVIITATATQYD